MIVRLLYSSECPNWRVTERHLIRIAGECGDLTIERVLITTEVEAIAARFHGSPTMQFDGVDPFAGPGDSCGLSCRLYQTPDGLAGSPTLSQISEAVRQAR